jgi:hypothetical protein
MAMGSGVDCMAIPISVSGAILKPRGMAFILGRTVTDMRASGEHVSNMVKAQTSLPTVISIQASIKKASLMEKDNILGRTGHFT